MKLRVDLVAPCGMNCGRCMRYLVTVRGLNKELRMPQCLGCKPRNKKCSFIKGKCELLKDGKVNFCFECKDFPCKKLETLDRRYTKTYNTTLIGNLLEIKEIGVARWLEKEEKRSRCPTCGGTISVHTEKCYDCGYQSS